MMTKLTPGALSLFSALYADARNWSGTPLFGGNVGGSKESCGHLTALKRAKLLRTWQDEDDRSCQWVEFTEAGHRLAEEIEEARTDELLAKKGGAL